jgi:putative membrane protein
VRLLKLVIVFLLIGLGASFASMNAGTVRLDFYFVVRDVPVSLALVLTLAAGALIGMLSVGGLVVRLKHENSELRRKMRLTSEEVNNLRALPIRDH